MTFLQGKTKVEVAKMIQATKGEVSIKYNKLHADPKQGKTLDIVMKKVKHKMVENMTSSTADALGLSRAILCNDSLVKKLEELERTEEMYRGLVGHARRVLMGYFDLVRVCKGMEPAALTVPIIRYNNHSFQSSGMSSVRLVSGNLRKQQTKRFVSLENITGRWRSLGSAC